MTSVFLLGPTKNQLRITSARQIEKLKTLGGAYHIQFLIAHFLIMIFGYSHGFACSLTGCHSTFGMINRFVALKLCSSPASRPVAFIEYNLNQLLDFEFDRPLLSVGPFQKVLRFQSKNSTPAAVVRK